MTDTTTATRPALQIALAYSHAWTSTDLDTAMSASLRILRRRWTDLSRRSPPNTAPASVTAERPSRQ